MLLITLGILGWLMVAARLSGYFLTRNFPCMSQSTKQKVSHNG